MAEMKMDIQAEVHYHVTIDMDQEELNKMTSALKAARELLPDGAYEGLDEWLNYLKQIQRSAADLNNTAYAGGYHE